VDTWAIEYKKAYFLKEDRLLIREVACFLRSLPGG